jgi:uncharacterized protein (DUF2267 family)
MAAHAVEGIDETVLKTRLWLREISDALGTGDDRHPAYLALRAVLHALRDRLSTDQAAQFAAQLPLLVRGIYYEGWDPAFEPEKVRSPQVFLARIAREAYLQDAPDPARAVRSVAQVIRRHISAGQFDEILGVLPAGIRDLFSAPTPAAL